MLQNKFRKILQLDTRFLLSFYLLIKSVTPYNPKMAAKIYPMKVCSYIVTIVVIYYNECFRGMKNYENFDMRRDLQY